MSRETRRPTFLREAVFGFVISLIAAAIAAAGPLLLPAPFVARLIAAGIGLACVLRVIAGSDERTGRIVALAFWAIASVVAWTSGAGLAVFVALQAVLIWLARSLFARGRVIEAGLDLGLVILALSGGVWAGLRTGSVFLAAWCFLLVLAMHPVVPRVASALLPGRARDSATNDDGRVFTDAYRAADEALRRMAARY